MTSSSFRLSSWAAGQETEMCQQNIEHFTPSSGSDAGTELTVSVPPLLQPAAATNGAWIGRDAVLQAVAKAEGPLIFSLKVQVTLKIMVYCGHAFPFQRSASTHTSSTAQQTLHGRSRPLVSVPGWAYALA